jgi:hypothetical protein
MPKHKTLKEAYLECETNGYFRDQEQINNSKVKSMLEISKAYFESAEKLKLNIDDNSFQLSVVYNLYYDCLRELAEALTYLRRKKIANHQCLFAYLGTNYSNLDLNWDFFEKIRTKRNGISYYGQPVSKKDFKDVEFQIKLYFSTLTKEVVKQL